MDELLIRQIALAVDNLQTLLGDHVDEGPAEFETARDDVAPALDRMASALEKMGADRG